MRPCYNLFKSTVSSLTDQLYINLHHLNEGLYHELDALHKHYHYTKLCSMQNDAQLIWKTRRKIIVSHERTTYQTNSHMWIGA